MKVVIFQNCGIHYMDVVFRALIARGLDFTVHFTASSSLQRFEANQFSDWPYSYRVAFEGAYEDAPKLRTAAGVWRWLNKIRPSCVVISGWNDLMAWSAWLWCRMHSTPMVLWAESNEFDRKRRVLAEAVKRMYLKPFRAAHVYGHSNKEYLGKLRFPEARVFMKRAVVDTKIFQPLPRVSPNTPWKTLVFVGRLVAEKNLSVLLAALSNVRQSADQPRLKLKLVGGGPLEQDLRSLVEAMRLTPFIDFHGVVLQADLPAVYSECDGLVLPSLSEAWGLVVNEAMCCGLPVMVSDRCGCAADLVNTETGWVFNHADVKQLTAILVEFAETDHSRLEAMGAAARKLASQYSAENCAALVCESIDLALARPAS